MTKKYFVDLCRVVDGKEHWGKVGEVEPAYLMVTKKPRFFRWRPTLGVIVNLMDAEGLALKQCRAIARGICRWGRVRIREVARHNAITMSHVLQEIPQNRYGRFLERVGLQ